MTAVSAANFGFLVAYIIPGFVVVAAASRQWPMLQAWLGTSLHAAPTVGGFLYVTLASVAAGMTISAIRWLVLDSLHHHTGIPQPNWDLSTLPSKLAGFETFVEYHYRYYQFYGNMLIALLLIAMGRRSFPVVLPASSTVMAGGMAILMVLFYIASRDALKKYYARTDLLLGAPSQSKETNDDQRLPLRSEGFQAGPARKTGPKAEPAGSEEGHDWWS